MKKVSILIVLPLALSLIFSSCKKDEVLVNQEQPSAIQDTDAALVFQMAKAEMTTEYEPKTKERGLIDQLYKMAQDVEWYYEGVEEEADWEAKYNRIRSNMHDRVDEVKLIAGDLYDGNEGKTILAINSYVLMSYHALERYMSEFMWTKLGLFAANEVRSGIALSFVLRQILTMTKIDLKVDELGGADVKDILYQSNQILIEGQINVFTDIGALGLLSHKYGPETFVNESWLTQEARDGYTVQVQAEEALKAGDISSYQDLQAEAAIFFGAHEQIYTLGPLWRTEVMGQLAELNIWMHNQTKGELALFGDIFIGVNKFTELLYGYVIKLPLSNHDLRIDHDRVEIARKGFHTLNKLRKNAWWAKWVKRSEDRLGQQWGVYNIKGFNP